MVTTSIDAPWDLETATFTVASDSKAAVRRAPDAVRDAPRCEPSAT